MITLLFVIAAILASCAAAAGLIVSTQNNQDTAQAMNGLVVGPDYEA